MNHRIFVEKRPEFQIEAHSLQNELNSNLELKINQLRLINVYDLFGFSDELLQKSRYQVFGEIVTDNVFENIDLTNEKYIAIEYLPGQFDQRASSAVDCVKLIDPTADVRIKSSKLLILNDTISATEIAKIKKYIINTVESREKDLAVLNDTEQAEVKPVKVLEGFTQLLPCELEDYCKKAGLAMNGDDLQCVIDYFKKEGRNPIETELRILDTYWSDHCRHTTFTTVLDEITINESFIKTDLENSLALYNKMRHELNRDNKDICLMDLATIGARYLRSKGYLDDMEVSEENNACSILINVDVNGSDEKWLLQFKNETHNHPTEIEPFGGAATCLGGAIRDPLSGRSYVYQAMRVTGAGNIYAPTADTLEGKLPQRIISTKAAHGYSSYGNQIGLATTHVREIYHEGYLAKRLEVGAVVGAVKAENVRRESPMVGDIVLLLGGRTGRDGIGGATGSSKEHNTQSLETCSSEVQKGNAPEERKLERLFRRPEVTRLIKKSNDFGAGGVSVAIGELADGLDIYLDRVPTKYSGLNSTELAISESQERMSVVIEAKDRIKFEKYCYDENIEVVHIADVTNTKRMRMFNKDRKVVDLARSFIDSAGAKHHTKANIASVPNTNPFRRTITGKNLKEKMFVNLSDNNVVSQKGLIEMFDSTIGASTVLMPFGGKTQTSETQVSVQKLPILNGTTNCASIMAFGYNPFITTWSPYHGAAYAVIESCAKVVAAGARFDKMRFSYQEYFERMHSAESWGKPLSALLGALQMQEELKLPSIGGKDSMSGTFQTINVPPMLMAFGITTVNANNVISTDLKSAGNQLYLIRHTPKHNYMPDTKQLAVNFNFISENIEKKVITSAYAIGFGGVSEAIAKMAFGNEIGANVTINESDLFDYNYGSILIETSEQLNFCNAELIGNTIDNPVLIINGEQMDLKQLYNANTEKFYSVYPDKGKNNATLMQSVPKKLTFGYKEKPIEKPIAYLPVFPGTNCDYDTAKAFRKAGAEITTSIFRNLNSDAIFSSITEMKQKIAACNILVLSGGFSAGDEPDGSGKFICNVLQNKEITDEIHRLIDRGGLILGICNGFQALIKSGLLPYGRLGSVTKESPTLFRNDINRHISQMVTTRVSSINSPWLSGFQLGEQHTVAMSHGEGKFVVSEKLAKELFANGQIAFQYVDIQGNITVEAPFNPNGSNYAIEGIISKNGQILGKMGHSERYEENLFKNISGNKHQGIFENAVNYFKSK
jgi:phosphoribosylformylglycinamidine synthase